MNECFGGLSLTVIYATNLECVVVNVPSGHE
jgi:hypothetical protein